MIGHFTHYEKITVSLVTICLQTVLFTIFDMLCFTSLWILIDTIGGFVPLRGFPGGSSGKESVCQYRRHRGLGFSPWVGKIPWRRKWQPTPVCSCLGNPVDRGAWRDTVCGVPKESNMTEHACALYLLILSTYFALPASADPASGSFSVFCIYKSVFTLLF